MADALIASFTKRFPGATIRGELRQPERGHSVTVLFGPSGWELSAQAQQRPTSFQTDNTGCGLDALEVLKIGTGSYRIIKQWKMESIFCIACLATLSFF